jgi:hypothetical protein
MGDEAASPRRAARIRYEPRGTAGSGMPEAVRVWLLGDFRVEAPVFLPLFTQPRRRGLLRSPYPRSCIAERSSLDKNWLSP